MSIIKDLGESILDKLKDSFTGAFGVSSMTYPSDLMSSAYGHSYVVFHINVNSRSRVLKSNTNLVSGSPSDLGSELAGQLANLTESIGLPGVVNKATKRLAASIALYTPNDLSIEYGVSWNENNNILLSGAMEGGEAVTKYIKGLAGTNMPNERITGGEGVGIGAEGAFAFGLGAANQLGLGGIGSAVGLAPNPKKEQLFEGVNFRKFQMQYLFAPRDAAEAKNVQKIINAFKYHMHPEFVSKSKFLYVYPSEFDIEYHYKSGNNPHIHKHTTAVLENMAVNYTPNSVYNIYDTGMPTQIGVTLNFVELMVATKESIEDGL